MRHFVSEKREGAKAGEGVGAIEKWACRRDYVATARILSRAARRFRSSAGARGNRVPAFRLAASSGDSIRRNDFLRRIGEARRQSQGIARSGFGERQESDSDRDSLSPGNRRRREARRIWRGIAGQTGTTHAGSARAHLF